MRATIIISLLASLYTNYLYADITIRYDLIRNNQKLAEHEVLLKQDLVRINNRPGQQSDFMLDLHNGDIVQLHNAQKSYFKTNIQTLNQYVTLYRQNKGLFDGLINQGLLQLAPHQRARVEHMMQRFSHGASTSSGMRLEDSGHTENILGVQCRVFAMYDQARHQRDICLADYRQLGLSAAEISSFQKLKKLVQQFRQSSADKQDLLSVLANGIDKLQGIPLKVVNFHPNGKVNSITQAASISLRTIAPEVYRIPASYQQKMMPVM